MRVRVHAGRRAYADPLLWFNCSFSARFSRLSASTSFEADEYSGFDTGSYGRCWCCNASWSFSFSNSFLRFKRATLSRKSSTMYPFGAEGAPPAGGCI